MNLSGAAGLRVVGEDQPHCQADETHTLTNLRDLSCRRHEKSRRFVGEKKHQ